MTSIKPNHPVPKPKRTIEDLCMFYCIMLCFLFAGIFIGKNLVNDMKDWQCIEYKLVPAQTYNSTEKDFISVCHVRKFVGELPK